MGEAKYRKEHQAGYGKIPKNGMGLIISPPMEINGTSVSVKQTALDEQLLRNQILYWDRLVWPESSAISFGNGQDEEFLISAGILSRPNFTFYGDVAQGMLKTQLAAFEKMNAEEPGQWAIAQGENALTVVGENFQPERGTLFSLYQAIPTPDKSVPLNDVLEFKLKRQSELIALRLELADLYQTILAAGDSELALRSALSRVEIACDDAIRVAKESKFAFLRSDWEWNFSLDPSAIITGAVGAIGNLAMGIPLSVAAFSGATLTLGKSIKYSDAKLSTPFRYVTSVHKEFI